MLVEDVEVPLVETELPEQLELQNMITLEEPAGQKETSEAEKEVAMPEEPPSQEKKPSIKEEL